MWRVVGRMRSQLSQRPVRFNSSLIRYICRCLLFIAAATPILETNSDVSLLVLHLVG